MRCDSENRFKLRVKQSRTIANEDKGWRQRKSNGQCKRGWDIWAKLHLRTTNVGYIISTFFLGLLNLLTSPESGLWFAFAEKQVTLLHQEVACQCPEACLWRHLVTRVIGSCLGVSSLVVTHGGHRHSVHSPHATRSRGRTPKATRSPNTSSLPEADSLPPKPLRSSADTALIGSDMDKLNTGWKEMQANLQDLLTGKEIPI